MSYLAECTRFFHARHVVKASMDQVRLFGTSWAIPALVIPCSAVLGSLLVVFADLAARMVNPPFETPMGALIALIVVPFFLYLARKQGRGL